MLDRSISDSDQPALAGTIRQRVIRAIVTAGAAVLVASAPMAHAAQLNFATTPLFLQNVVQPNILFLLDDSGSMDWSVLPNNGASADSNFCDPNNSSTCRTLDLTPNDVTERLELCSGYNVLAFNPSLTYTPWKGSDSAAVAYKDAWLYGGGTDASPNYSVRQNPY